MAVPSTRSEVIQGDFHVLSGLAKRQEQPQIPPRLVFQLELAERVAGGVLHQAVSLHQPHRHVRDGRGLAPGGQLADERDQTGGGLAFQLQVDVIVAGLVERAARQPILRAKAGGSGSRALS